MAAAQRQLHARGWLDTTARIQEALAADPYISHLFSRNANLGMLRDEKTDIISAAITICCGIRYVTDERPVPSREYVIALTIGELMSPVLPVDMSLGVAEATAVFSTILDSLLSVGNQYTRRHSVAEWLEQLLEAGTVNGEDDDQEGERDLNVDRGEAAHINELRENLLHNRLDEINLEDKISFLIWLASKLPQTMYLDTVLLIVTSYVGIAKRGTISERFITKIQNGMTTDVGVNVELSSEIIQQAYNVFGRHVNAGNAQGVFDRWLADIPEHALRLRLTLAFIIVGRAMSKYNTFQWAKRVKS